MSKHQGHKTHVKGKDSLPQTPSYAKLPSDGRDIEFAQEFADQDDVKAQDRSKEADAHVKSEN
ncbi:YfhD family protein [Bacillus sp. DJP31]|uniref:YfhD family protein n=1 Tax=Bacillus sp. DJP31 TaxID=3409789 RepID=UPI003BB4C3EB